MSELQFYQVDRPVRDRAASDVVRSFVFLANLAAQEAAGDTGASVSTNRAVQRLAGSTESDALMLVLADGPAADLGRSGYGYPLVPATSAPEPELDIHGFLHFSIPLHEDTDTVEVELVLDAAHQPIPGAEPSAQARQVYLRLLTEAARLVAVMGRQVLQLWETHRPAATAPFAAELTASGYAAALCETQGVIELRGLPTAAPTPGVSVVVLPDRRPPEELLPGVLELLRLASVDVPRGQLRSEPQEWSAQRLAESEAHRRDTGVEVLLAVLIDATGPAALCEIHRHPASEPGTIEQGVTIVHPRVRGRGLGHQVKCQALTAARQCWPGTQRVFTSNALVNLGMLAVNRALGIREISRATAWQLVLPA